MKAEQTVLQKAIELKKKYGKDKAVQIMFADQVRYERNNDHRKREECKMVIKNLNNGVI